MALKKSHHHVIALRRGQGYKESNLRNIAVARDEIATRSHAGGV